ncbi:MAG: Rpn family recombination-promoting nuclease/putative transposase, partial [Fusobacteriaceae bacterium]
LTGWGMFLKQPASDIVEEAEETVIEIKKAKEELYKISADEDERELYRIREKAYLDEISALAEAEAKGLAKGMAKGIERTAKNMLAKGIGIDMISELTGLSKEEIKKIKN